MGALPDSSASLLVVRARSDMAAWPRCRPRHEPETGRVTYGMVRKAGKGRERKAAMVRGDGGNGWAVAHSRGACGLDA